MIEYSSCIVIIMKMLRLFYEYSDTVLWNDCIACVIFILQAAGKSESEYREGIFSCILYNGDFYHNGYSFNWFL